MIYTFQPSVTGHEQVRKQSRLKQVEQVSLAFTLIQHNTEWVFFLSKKMQKKYVIYFNRVLYGTVNN